MTQQTTSKDQFFSQLASISDAMIAAHGMDFAMGTLVLSARFIAEREARERAAAEAGNGTAASAGVIVGNHTPEPSRIISSRVS
jgi:hypothetical protein